ncbi:MAG: TetR/AcrR family transcriptional regulator, partial [Caulobacteraceae bacterium]
MSPMPDTSPVSNLPVASDRLARLQRRLNDDYAGTEPPSDPLCRMAQTSTKPLLDPNALYTRPARRAADNLLKRQAKRSIVPAEIRVWREKPVAAKDTASYLPSMTTDESAAVVLRSPATRGDKRLRTRRTLVSAAAELIALKGFDRVSLDEICARAGMTRGAFHGNFESRDALFMAVMEQETAPVSVQFQPGAPLQVQMRLLGQAVFAHARERLQRRALTAAIQLHLMTRPDLLKQRAEATAAGWRSMAGGFTRLVPAGSLPMPAERFVKVIDALTA